MKEKSSLSGGPEEQKLRNQETVERHKDEFSDNRLKISPRFGGKKPTPPFLFPVSIKHR